MSTFTTQLYYGRVSLTHYDGDCAIEIANVIHRALTEAGLPSRLKVEWIHHRDGVDTVDSRWNGKKWVKAAR